MRIQNKKAQFDYDILERVEAGVVLMGAEVKAAKLGQVDMAGAHVKILNSKFEVPNKSQIQNSKTQAAAWIVGMQIYPYKFASDASYDPMRTRKLLLNKRELLALETKMKTGRLTLVPTAIYTRHNLVKLEIGLARGKRKYEKREKIKKRDLERESN